jgi:uncharacterized membrane protein YoaK (UPF0700 family)
LVATLPEGDGGSAALSRKTDAMIHAAPAPSVDSTLGMKLLPNVLGLTAGAVDVISFLGLGGLFAAHITGNLVILAAQLVDGGVAPVAHVLSVPVFMAALGLTRLLASGLEMLGLATLRPLLALQALLLAGVFVIGVSAGAPFDPTAPRALTAGMLAVAAMAVQNAVVQISLTGAPSTALMTTNITRSRWISAPCCSGATPTRWQARVAAPGAPGR